MSGVRERSSSYVPIARILQHQILESLAQPDAADTRSTGLHLLFVIARFHISLVLFSSRYVCTLHGIARSLSPRIDFVYNSPI